MTPSTQAREKHAPAHKSLTDQAVAFIDTHPGVTIPEIAAGLGHPHHWRLAKRSGDLKARGYVTCEIGERRVGKECLRLCRSRWSPYH